MRAAAVLSLLLWLAPSPAHAGLADRIGATFALMSQELVAAFRPVEAMVVAVEGDTVYLDLGALAGVQVGQEFTVFRKGEAFQHPLTGKSIGRFEEVLGFAQARRVQPQFTEATFIPREPGARPQPEDGVRISRGRIKVAVAPLLDLTGSDADLRRVPFLLSTALDRSKRFQVADPLTVTDLSHGGPPREESGSGRLARPDPDHPGGCDLPRRHVDLRGHRNRAILAAPGARPGRRDRGAAVPVGAPHQGLRHLC